MATRNLAAQETQAAEHSASRQWIRDAFACRGLAFMLDRPVPAIRAEAAKLFGGLITSVFRRIILVILLVAVFVRLFASGVLKDVALGTVALITVPIVLLVLVVAARGVRRADWAEVLEWSKVGNSMAVMLGFVALAFFSADSWRTAGAIPWSRLGLLAVVFTVLAARVLYRQAFRIIGDVLEAPINIDDVKSSKVEDPLVERKVEDPLVERMLRDPLVKMMLTGEGELSGNSEIPRRAQRRAQWNLRFIVAILLARRILISGIIVSAALFLVGFVIIDQQRTIDLMNATNSPAVIGFTHKLGTGSYQFFLSESLLKVSLMIGLIAAAYFVFANPDPDKSQDRQVLRFVRKIIILWTCYWEPGRDQAHPIPRPQVPPSRPAIATAVVIATAIPGLLAPLQPVPTASTPPYSASPAPTTPPPAHHHGLQPLAGN